MASEMRVALLGSVEVSSAGRTSSLSRSRLRAVLGLLALRAGRVVPVEALIDGLHGEDPPPAATRTLHAHVSHLRRSLSDLGAREIVETRSPGYRLALPESSVDVFRFQQGVSAGRAALAAGDAMSAATTLAATLAMWRGDALADCGVHGWAHGESGRLRELRMAATEDLLDARIRLGDHRATAAELEALVTVDPLREHLWELLMTAHALAGRQADALRVYQRVRRVLLDELGLEPGPELRRLEAAVLSGEPLSGTTTTTGPNPRTGPPAPAQRNTQPTGPAPTAADRHSKPASEPAKASGSEFTRESARKSARESVRESATEPSREVGGGAGGAALEAVRPAVSPVPSRAPGGVLPPRLAYRSESSPAERAPGAAPPPRLAYRGPVGASAAQGGRPSGGTRRPGAAPVGSLAIRHAPERVESRPATPPVTPRAALSRAVPVVMTRLIGRDADLAQVSELVTAHRLVTLTGPGGVGKTRLAGAVAALVGEGFDRVEMVELTGVATAEFVVPAVADALGVHATGARGLEAALAEALRGRRVLLVLDNCEHVAAEVAYLAHWLLGKAADVHLLVTSREVLHVTGEVVRPVRPLAAHGPELFLERAGLSADLSPADAAALERICAELDGLPLALELAAARARVLSLTEIADRLNDRFSLLTGGPRTALPHHRGLRAACEWSFQLLDDEERDLLAALSVFTGGFDLAAAAAVAGHPDELAVLDTLARLVDKSLLTADVTPGGARYGMLETIRRFAAETLGEGERARRAHAAHFLALAEEAERGLRGATLVAALDRMSAEHANLRAALGYATGDQALRLAVATWRYLYLRGHYSEGRQWLESTLSGEAPTPLLAKALVGLATLTAYQCDYPTATGYAERVLEIEEDPGALSLLGEIARETGRHDDAIAHHERAMSHHEARGDTWGVGFQLELMALAGWLATRWDEARDWATRAHGIFAGLGDKERLGWTLLDLAAVDHYTGRDPSARLMEAERLFGEVGFPEGQGWTENLLALTALGRGEVATAAAHLRTALRIQRDLGDLCRGASLVEAMARAAHLAGETRRAAELVGGASVIRTAIGSPVPPAERADLGELRASLAEVLGEAAYQEALASGRGHTVPAVLAVALGS
ncbi:hypothetical protein GT755_04555 [Herbidospora sp. NEAU-GS84]|uniref:OmpR/PhoB-type domain-containing protein n=1 Tax=Herbidospora solisilvae TaxID=2696284 RepID=A0A7C9NKW4_9ACTN|nr:BTAD domain-containing putative transcriptional regulator [Herbidospora solisilvae]NAS20956.1 hypothetical protein [Herbidospora solisilvae]